MKTEALFVIVDEANRIYGASLNKERAEELAEEIRDEVGLKLYITETDLVA